MSAVTITNDPREATKRTTIRLVYLLAASHSGSTLTAMLLGSHPETCTAGELKLNSLGDLNRYRCSCLKPIRECPFWNDIVISMQKRGVPFDLADAGTDIAWRSSGYVRRLLRPLHRGRLLEAIRDLGLNLSPKWRAAYPEILLRNKELLASIAKRSGVNTIIDSSKVGIRLKYMLRLRDIDVQVIRIVRDGRAVALTYMDPAHFADATDPKLREGGQGGTRESEKLSIASAAREWVRSNEEAEKILSGLRPDQYLQVRYEDLCASPSRTMDRLFRFIGVDPTLAPKQFRAAEHHVIGNGMRLDSTSEIRLDDRWKSVLTGDQLQQFQAIAGDMNRKLGYDE